MYLGYIDKYCVLTSPLLACVTTSLVVLSRRFYFWKNRLRRRNPRRTVMGTTDRRGGLVSKHLEILKLGTENRLSELRNRVAGRTVTGHSPKIKFLNYATDSRMDRRRRDGPSQLA